MKTQNIQIGIDLGTTNSEIAVNDKGKIVIIKNINQDQYTPSVFGVDKLGNIIIGKKASERLYHNYSKEDESNTVAEIKRQMGSAEKKHFNRLKKSLLPEEISAEILKSLKADALRSYPDLDTSAVVITVPASFSTLQSEATKRAGNLAGFEHVILLQEPIAAAVAYGFGNSANETWLVYDLGGGTFDSALISYQDGLLNILGHEGDNFLGGKNFDWLLVDKLIIPKILEEYKLNAFSRDNPKYHSFFDVLKHKAEVAKIELSQMDKTIIEIENITSDESGKDIYLQIEISRKDLESLIEPAVNKSIDLVKKTIKDAGIKKSALARIILIGGPTQIPYIRRRLKEEFETNVDTSVDPFTAVAYGACIFATGQKIPQKTKKKIDKTKNVEYELKLNYDSMTSDNETMISGIVEQIREIKDDYFVQIQSESGLYNSSKLKLKQGKFIETIPLEKNKSNLFWIYLFDNKGNSLPLSVDSFSVTQGLTIKGVPLPHSIGVSYIQDGIGINTGNSEKFAVFFEKGRALPLTHTETFRTARKLIKDSDNILPIKVYEGEAQNPLNNTFVCGLDIDGSKLPYDVPAGTEIEITISINESRELDVSAYIPIIDLTDKARATYWDENIDLNSLKKDFDEQKKEMNEIENACNNKEKSELNTLIQSINLSLKNATVDEDEKKKVIKDIKEFKNTIEVVKKGSEMPRLIKEFKQGTSDISQLIREFANVADKPRFLEDLDVLIKEGEKAISENDKGILKGTIEKLNKLGSIVFHSNPNSWLYHFKELESGKYEFTNQQEAQYYLKKGRDAINDNDPNETKRCVMELWSLTKQQDKERIDRKLSGITK